MDGANLCEDVVLTPSLSNEVIEEKLIHLKPVLEGILSDLKELHEAWRVRDCTWKDMWDTARNMAL